jgi:hypothetical protein
MAHMRSNLTFRVPRSAFGQALDVNLHPETRELQVSALFVKGIHDLGGGDTGYFHVQITASGVGEMGRNSEVELFKKVPDIDLLHRFQGLTDAWVVVTLRGIGEISGDRAAATPNRVTTGGPQGPFDFGVPRAMVRLDVGPAGSRQLRLWDAMDAACDELAQLFAAGGPITTPFASNPVRSRMIGVMYRMYVMGRRQHLQRTGFMLGRRDASVGGRGQHYGPPAIQMLSARLGRRSASGEPDAPTTSRDCRCHPWTFGRATAMHAAHRVVSRLVPHLQAAGGGGRAALRAGSATTRRITACPGGRS